MRTRAAFAIAMLAAAPAAGRTSLGTFDGWGAFRDESPLRCYAIAQPTRSAGGRFRAFMSVSSWPQAGAKGQIHIRLGREVAAGTPLALVINQRRFALIGSGADAWAPDARTDAAIVANLRSARTVTVEARGRTSEIYALSGAATAIDAASLGCARR